MIAVHVARKRPSLDRGVLCVRECMGGGEVAYSMFIRPDVFIFTVFSLNHGHQSNCVRNPRGTHTYADARNRMNMESLIYNLDRGTKYANRHESPAVSEE